MDRLTAFVAIAHMRLRLDIVQRHPHLLEKDMATPFLQGLTKAMDMLEHDLEEDAKGLMTKIESLGPRGKAAMAKSHARVDGVANRVAEVEKFVTSAEGSNGGNSSGSSISSGGSTEQQPSTEKPASSEGTAAEPAASWGGQK